MFDDKLDIVYESHVQHLIGLIQHQTGQSAQFQRPAAYVVHHAPGSADYYIHAFFQSAQLHIYGLASIHRYHVQSLAAFQGVYLIRDLYGQFPGRRQNKRLHMVAVFVQLFNQRQPERCRFSGPGLRLADDVFSALHQYRNYLCLYGSGFFESFGLYGRQR